MKHANYNHSSSHPFSKISEGKVEYNSRDVSTCSAISLFKLVDSSEAHDTFQHLPTTMIVSFEQPDHKSLANFVTFDWHHLFAP